MIVTKADPNTQTTRFRDLAEDTLFRRPGQSYVYLKVYGHRVPCDQDNVVFFDGNSAHMTHLPAAVEVIRIPDGETVTLTQGAAA